MMKNETFTLWFNRKFLEWQDAMGSRQLITAFVDYLRIPQPVVSHYLKGVRVPDPDGEYAYLIYLRFPDVYDVFGITQPDIDRFTIKFNLNYLTNDEISTISHSIRERMGEYNTKQGA